MSLVLATKGLLSGGGVGGTRVIYEPVKDPELSGYEVGVITMQSLNLEPKVISEEEGKATLRILDLRPKMSS